MAVDSLRMREISRKGARALKGRRGWWSAWRSWTRWAGRGSRGRAAPSPHLTGDLPLQPACEEDESPEKEVFIVFLNLDVL